MLTVTESAKRRLKEILLTHTDDTETGLRLSLRPPGQLGVVLGKEAKDDQVVEQDGAKVLLIGQELEPLLQEVILDAQHTADGPKLVVRRK